MKKSERFQRVIEYFLKHKPQAETELVYKTPYELVVAVILSAQCTDKRVNMITPEFLKKFPSPWELAEAGHTEVYEIIKSCSYPNNKAKNLIGMAKKLVEKFGGTLPSNVDELQELPGVGRKTANVVLGEGTRKIQGVTECAVLPAVLFASLAGVEADHPGARERELRRRSGPIPG